MKKKLIFSLIVFIIAIGAASASDLNSTAMDDTANEIAIDDTLKIAEEDPISSTKIVSGQTFADIQATIDSAQSGDTIELSGTYTGSSEMMIYSKSLTIIGKNNATLDANEKSGIFRITDSEVTFKNIKFTNAKVTDSARSGAAIRSGGSSTEIYNCQFSNCKITGDYGEGGALYACWAHDSTFENCEAEKGGAMRSGYADNCTFSNCKATYGGATYDVYAENCRFDASCKASEGNSMYEGIAKNCEFGSSYYKTDIIREGIIKLSQSGKYYGKAQLVIELLDKKTNTPIENCELAIKITNEITYLKTDSNGMISYVPSLNPGKYTVKVDSIDYTVSTETEILDNFTVEKEPVKQVSGKLSPSKLSTTYASGKYFQVKLTTADNQPLQAIKLNLKIYTGNKYKNVAVNTDKNGIAKYPTSALGIGTHKVIVSVKDTKSVKASAKTSSIKITKASYSISAPTVTNGYKQSETFKITVKNKASGKALSGVKVAVKVYTGKKYKTYTLKTNSKGQVSINTKALTKATHKVSITIKASSKYKAASKSSSFKIVNAKIKTQFKFNNMDYNYYPNGALESVTVYVDLVDSNGKTLKKSITGQIYADQYGDINTYGPAAKGTSGSGIKIYRDIGSWRSFAKIDFAGDSKYKRATITVDINYP